MDNEKQIKLELEEKSNPHSYKNQEWEGLVAQVDYEYQLCWDHQYAKKVEQLQRLKLYNNQRRDKDAVGDTTMFTTMQTVLASLYSDELTVEFGGREEGDQEVAENLNQMAKFDYAEMRKDLIDFNWIWDTLFFGRGLVTLYEYLRDPDNHKFVPVPEVIDPTIFFRDPRAVAINGDNATGKNSARFFGYPIHMTKQAMLDNPHFFDDIDWTEIKHGGGTKSIIDEAQRARNDAQGHTDRQLFKEGEEHLNDNAEYELLMWFTHWRVNGVLKKVRVYSANQRQKVLGFEVLHEAKQFWRVIDRTLYPTAHDWDGTSIPDLTEDKQRHRAVAQNLGLRAMTADLYPNYIYDQNKVKNQNDLKFGFNKFIPVDGNPDAILPMRRAAPNMGLLDFIYNTLDISAQKATATPEIQQGMRSEVARPLGETNIIASKVDTRTSLSAKIFGWSERMFWIFWYLSYKENFAKMIDKKVLRLSGAFGAKWRELDRDNIVAHIDPDVEVESTVVSKAKQMEERQMLTTYFSAAMQDPNTNRRYALRRLGKLNGMPKDELDRLFPPTIDEMQAEDENEELNKGEFVRVMPEQDHHIHLEIHAKAKQTPALMAHIETHKHALMKMKTNPEAFPTQNPNAGAANPTGTGSTQGLMNNSSASGGVAPSQTSGGMVLQG